MDKKYDYVIQAIEHLKHRKARPDLEGIKNYAFRRHGIDPVTCCADVDQLIATDFIIKVEFKGRTSYRNASKFLGTESASSTHESSPKVGPSSIRDPSPAEPNYSSAVTAAIAAILCDQPTPPSQTGAVSIRSIASYLQSRDHGRYSRKYIDNLIEREVANCNIAAISRETFTLPPSVLKNLDRRWKREHSKNNKANTSVTSEDLNKSKNNQQRKSLNNSKVVVEKSPPPTPPRPERVGQRMKRAKKVFDPSDVEVVPRKRGRPVGTGKKNRNSFATTPERSKSPFNLTGSSPLNSYSHSGEFKACIICKYYTVISRGVTSKMLACSECNRNVHAKCLGFDQDVLPRGPEAEWKCPDCRPCSICKLIQDEDQILLCCECDTTFHRTCLNPVPAVVPDVCNWVCDDCHSNESVEKTPIKDSSSDEGKISIAAPPPSHQQPQAMAAVSPFFPSAPNSLGPWVFGTRQLELKGPPFEWDAVPPPDPSIPDAAQWTPDEVQSYFSNIGFEEQAALFRQNDIDGPSLLLMKRTDVVGNLGLKLGPAVKIYNQIRRLQTRRNDLIYA